MAKLVRLVKSVPLVNAKSPAKLVSPIVAEAVSISKQTEPTAVNAVKSAKKATFARAEPVNCHAKQV